MEEKYNIRQTSVGYCCIWQNVGWCDDSREDQEVAVLIILFVLPRQYNNNNGILKVTDVHLLNSKQSVPLLLP